MAVGIGPAKRQEVKLGLPLLFPVGAHDQKLLRMRKESVPSHSSQYFHLAYPFQESKAIADTLAHWASSRNMCRL